VVKANARLK